MPIPTPTRTYAFASGLGIAIQIVAVSAKMAIGFIQGLIFLFSFFLLSPVGCRERESV
jgi:hypothetical protein